MTEILDDEIERANRAVDRALKLSPNMEMALREIAKGPLTTGSAVLIKGCEALERRSLARTRDRKPFESPTFEITDLGRRLFQSL